MRALLFVLLAAGKSAHPAAKPAPPGSVIVIGRSAPRWTGEPISLDLKDVDLVDVCLSFSKIAKANVVIDPGVRGSVTVRLTDVPWDQALDLILRMNGLAMTRDGRILRIGKPASLVR